MRYEVRVRIAYEFAAPAGGGRNHLRLLPAALPGEQIIRAARLTVDPEPSERRDFIDFFGNAVTEVALPSGIQSVAFEARSEVERIRPDPRPDVSVPLRAVGDEVAAVQSLDPGSPQHLAGWSPRIIADPGVRDFARSATSGAETVVAAIERLGLALHSEMIFDADATTVDTLPAEAFRARRGVCQDFAQVMIGGLRALGIPAGYASGFLRTVPPPGKPRLEGADAMHAWVRAWGGRLHGWVEYDPTNAMPAGEDHITVARGRDYGDVAPVAGVLRIAGGQKSTQAVDVVPLPQLVRG